MRSAVRESASPCVIETFSFFLCFFRFFGADYLCKSACIALPFIISSGFPFINGFFRLNQIR